VRQHRTGNHIADGVNAFDICAEIFVHFDASLFIELDADFFRALGRLRMGGGRLTLEPCLL
jgi:hypothetical protein